MAKSKKERNWERTKKGLMQKIFEMSEELVVMTEDQDLPEIMPLAEIEDCHRKIRDAFLIIEYRYDKLLKED